MKKFLNTILVSLFLLLITCSISFANTYSGGSASYNSTSKTLTLTNGTYTINDTQIKSNNYTTWGLDVITGDVSNLDLNNCTINIDNSTGFLNWGNEGIGTSTAALNYAVSSYTSASAGILVNSSLNITGSGSINVSKGNALAFWIYTPANETYETTLTIGTEGSQNDIIINGPLTPFSKNYTAIVVGAGVGDGTGYASAPGTLTLESNVKVYGLPAIITFSGISTYNPPNFNETQVNINGSYITIPNINPLNSDRAVIRGYGVNNQDFEINVGPGSTINGGETQPAFYITNDHDHLNIDGANISGFSGIVARGGNINIGDSTIIGTGNSKNPDTPSNSAIGSGAAIDLPTSNSNPYGGANLKVTNSKLESNYNAPVTTSETSNNTVAPESISITDSDLVSNNNTPMDLKDYSKPDNPPFQAIGSGVTSNVAIPEKNINQNEVNTVAATKDGVYGYFSNKTSEGTKELQKFLNSNPGSYILPSIDAVPTVPSADTTQSVLSVAFSNKALQYYQVSGTQAVKQTQNIGLELISIPYNTYFANALNWTITPVASETPIATFTSSSDWQPDTDENGNFIYATDGGFTLKQYIIQGENNKAANGPAYLVYNGSTPAAGIYTLTATTENTTPPVWNNKLVNKAPSATTRILINQSSNIDNVTITNLDGTTATNPVKVDINTTRSMRFSYIAVDTKDNPVIGNIVTWNLNYTDQEANIKDYAYINSTTGLITFYQPTAPGEYLILSVTVDGVQSNNILIQVTGEEGELDGITYVQSPIFLPTSQNAISYNLAGNVEAVPNGMYINPANLSFTSSNQNIIVYNGTNGTSLIPLTPNYVGFTVITATYKTYDEDGEVEATFTTAFEVELVEKAVPATGISVEETLTFIYGETSGQNVNATLTPYGTTTPFNRGDATYVSDNNNVAIVSDSGEVQATGLGDAIITTTYTLPTNNKVVTAQTFVIVTDEAPVTAIELSPQDIVLSTDGDNTSQVITATLTPEDSSAIVSWNISPETVATLVDNGDNTATVTAVADGEAYVTATVGDVTATTKVTVTSSPVVVGSVEITSESPDYFTVTAYNVTSMVEGETPQYLALFAWSNEDHDDINAKPMTHIDGTDNWVVENIPVNDNAVNNYFDMADTITLNMYGSNDPDDNGSEIWNGTYSWVNDQNIGDNSVAYIAYSQNIGFDRPTVFDGAETGTTGQALQMEGLRVSSGIEGVQIEANVHVENVGWMGYVADGTYAGTMFKNLQLEAVQLRLVGDNAGDYTLRYRAHVENYGWQDWVTTDQIAGTTGNNLQMEAIEIELLPVDSTN